jgi:hypothetical protein
MKMTTPTENTTNKTQLQSTLDGTILNQSTFSRSSISKKVYPKTVYLKSKRSWKKLFNGFSELRGITYVSSPEYILDQYSDYDFEKIELIIGSGLMDGYKKNLDGKNTAIHALYSRICDGSLVLFGTKATVHTKLYILKDEEKTRIIIGSPNLSYNAEGSRQREYAVYFDIFHGDSIGLQFLEQVNEDYSKHLQETDIIRFMEDLQNLRHNSDNNREEDFVLWCGSDSLDSRRVIRGVVKDIHNLAFIEDDEAEESFTIMIPDTITKQDKKILTHNYDARIHDGRATISRSWVLDEKRNLGMPLMRIDQNSGKVTIALGGRKFDLNANVSPQEINAGLADIENYIRLVDQAICHHPKAVKMTMMETVLYTMAAPFANEWLRQKRKRTRLTDRTGPRHLIVYGPGGNGKTTFGRFQNHLISTNPFEPVDGKNYVKKDWDNLFNHVSTSDSPFPVIVDDIKSSCFGRARGNLEGRVKAYFENNWESGNNFPMMIFNTNHDNIAEWAKRRVRKLDFLVKFQGNEKEQLQLEAILQRPNHVFPAFAKIYSEELLKGEGFSHDELKLARTVFVKLYTIADRQFPDFFPERPPEEMYDMDAIYCVDLNSYGLFTEEKVKGERGEALKLHFEDYRTLNSFNSRLPPSVSTMSINEDLIIQNPGEYREFMERGREKSKPGIFSRLFSKQS